MLLTPLFCSGPRAAYLLYRAANSACHRGHSKQSFFFHGVEMVVPRLNVSLLSSDDDILMKALHVVVKGDGGFKHRTLDSFCLLYRFLVLYFDDIHLDSQPNKFQHDLSVTFIFHQTNLLFIGSWHVERIDFVFERSRTNNPM